MKDLKRKLADLRISLDVSKKRCQELKHALDVEMNTIKSTEMFIQVVESDIRKAATVKEPITITDHALIRYLERRLGLNMDTVRIEILSDPILKVADKCGDGRYGNYQIRQRKIVTVYD